MYGLPGPHAKPQPMSEFLTPGASLASLFVAAFVAATLVPLSSEAALFGVLRLHPELFWPAILAATAGNTLGGLTTYGIGRFVATRKPPSKQLDTVSRYGAPALLFAWAPLVGDALCLAAGWLRIGWLSAAFFQALGRFVRYALVASGTAALP